MGIPVENLTDQIRSRMIPADRKKLGKRGQTSAEAEHVRVTRSERKIHDLFISFLHRYEIPYTHSDTTRKSSIKKGHPDFLVGLIDNRGFYIEFKVPPNSLLAHQTDYIRFLETKGNRVLMAVETFEGAAYKFARDATALFFNLDISNEW